MTEPFGEYIATLHLKINQHTEEWLRLYIKPRPWFMPNFIYRWILKRVVVCREDRRLTP